MTNGKFDALVRRSAAEAQELLTQLHMDMAASIQAVLDEAVLRLTRSIAAETGMQNLCLAGGVALNCVANGKIFRDGRFERIVDSTGRRRCGRRDRSGAVGYHLNRKRGRSTAVAIRCGAPISARRFRKPRSNSG